MASDLFIEKVSEEVSKKKAQKLKCKTPGCKHPHHAQGYCQNCYDDLRKKKKAGNVKLNTNHKKAAPAAAKSTKDTKELKKPHEEPVKELPQLKGKMRKGKISGTQIGEITNPAEEAAKLTRLGMIKARHEAMKREIDQIREDLESEEEE